MICRALIPIENVCPTQLPRCTSRNSNILLQENNLVWNIMKLICQYSKLKIYPSLYWKPYFKANLNCLHSHLMDRRIFLLKHLKFSILINLKNMFQALILIDQRGLKSEIWAQLPLTVSLIQIIWYISIF